LNGKVIGKLFSVKVKKLSKKASSIVEEEENLGFFSFMKILCRPWWKVR